MIEIELKMPDGRFKQFKQDFIPFGSKLTYTKTEKELLEKDDPTEKQVSLTEYQAEFVASLFDEEEVTGEVILNGLNNLKYPNLIAEIIYHDVLSVPRNLNTEGESDPKE